VDIYRVTIVFNQIVIENILLQVVCWDIIAPRSPPRFMHF